jgi:hypothetical protein
MRDTVPASWLRAESCQPAKSVTSTTAEALISAIASLPFLSLSRWAASAVMVAVIVVAALQAMLTWAETGPSSTAPTVPANWLRAVVFMDILRSRPLRAGS